MCTAWGDKLHQEFNSLTSIFLCFRNDNSGALSHIRNFAGSLINFRCEAVCKRLYSASGKAVSWVKQSRYETKRVPAKTELFKRICGMMSEPETCFEHTTCG